MIKHFISILLNYLISFFLKEKRKNEVIWIIIMNNVLLIVLKNCFILQYCPWNYVLTSIRAPASFLYPFFLGFFVLLKIHLSSNGLRMSSRWWISSIKLAKDERNVLQWFPQRPKPKLSCAILLNYISQKSDNSWYNFSFSLLLLL